MASDAGVDRAFEEIKYHAFAVPLETEAGTAAKAQHWTWTGCFVAREARRLHPGGVLTQTLWGLIKERSDVTLHVLT